MKLYFPESNNQLEYCGYNNLVRMFRLALGEYVSDTPEGCAFRVYCNLPWHHYPKWLKKEGLPLIVYTMYESTRVPAGWVKFLNQSAAIVLVPSQWCKEVFLNSGVEKPIQVLSGCYDDFVIKPIIKSKRMDQFVYLWQGVALDAGGRKGADIAYKAFKELKKEGALGNDARLIMKYRPYEHTEMVFRNLETAAGVIYEQSNLTRQEMIELYASVDCCINPTHGEGFGLIPLEQMAMGKPVIVTGWSMDYLKEAPHIPITYELKTSPVIWNHKTLRINLNGFAFNYGGLIREYQWLPHRMNYVEDGTELSMQGLPVSRLSRWKKIKGRVHNALVDLQGKTRFYIDQRRKVKSVYQENPGLDAWADLEDLKDGMLWAYKNKDKAFQLGFEAGEWAARNMGVFRMRENFEQLKPYLEHLKGA